VADPIVVFDRADRRKDPRQPILATYRTIFLYSVSPPVVDALGATVAPTPTSSLSAEQADVLSAGELAGLDSGALAFSVEDFDLAPGQPLAGLVAQAQVAYPTRKAEIIAAARARFLRVGFRVAVAGESV
jgi:hypothetical protein